MELIIIKRPKNYEEQEKTSRNGTANHSTPS